MQAEARRDERCSLSAGAARHADGVHRIPWYWLLSVLLPLWLAGVVDTGTTLLAEEDPALVLPPPRSAGEKVAIDSLPVVVQRTMHKEGGDDLAVAYRHIDATGATVYVAHITDAEGIHQLLTVGEDGGVESRVQVRRRDNTLNLGPTTDHASSPDPTPASTIPHAGALADPPAHSP